MTRDGATIRDVVEVRRHPTVVRLQDLEGAGSDWLGQSFVLTPEVQSHLQALGRTLAADGGSGVFLIGHYGSGKSHFLAYLTLLLRGGGLVERRPDVVPISLVNFSAVANRLEDIVAAAVGLSAASGDRRPAWETMIAAHPRGLVLVVDELSEFLRAKPDAHAFNEDVRFLQFVAEWARDRPLWIVAAMQEGIEHTGELEYSLYRKIKDRYPLRLLLTPAHVRSLVADGILVKKPGYESAVDEICRGLRETYTESQLDFQALRAIYPIHPATLELLEEVRDRFSQARGVVDFAVTRLAGDAARGVEPFLDRPLGGLLTPETIIAHFRDLLEVQSEFLPLSQQVLPWYEKHLHELFERPAERALAQKLLDLLVLVHLSPAREAMRAEEAAAWLVFSAARVEPERNRKIVERVLGALATRGRYVAERGGAYRLNLEDDGGATLQKLLARELAAIEKQDALVFETLLPLLPAGGFNPFELPRDQWQQRRVLWRFHERRFAVWLGSDTPAPIDGIGVCLRLPWDEAPSAPGLYTIQPARLGATQDLAELAALVRLGERPGNPDLARRIELRLDARRHLLPQALRSAWQDARLITPDGKEEPAPRLEAQSTLQSWLEAVALSALRRTYPAFERFAPGYGPLPREALLRFMRFAAGEDIGAADADDYVKLIREAYLVPMGLLRRKGREYAMPANLDGHELVRLLEPLLEHAPSPRTLHEHFAQPIYGLVADQVNVLLVFLTLQGEIDILKGRHSYRDAFETLPNPLQYDRVVAGHGLRFDQLHALERLCDGLGIRRPAQWTVLTERRAAAQLDEVRRRQVERLAPLALQLRELPQGEGLAARIEQHVERWNALGKGGHVLQGLEHFLFEIGSPAAFLDEVRTYEDLRERAPRLLGETRRYAHLFRHPAVRQAAAEAEGFDLESMPGLEDPHALDQWLGRAGEAYERYKRAYADRHERWWEEAAAHAIWTWRAPPLAASRHLDLAPTLSELEACRREAEHKRCRGLVNLDYQPECACGFDGETAPVAALSRRFDAARETIEARLRRFFEQEGVKARLRDWQREGIEMTSGTLAYLEGSEPVPEVHDVAAFDQYLSGVELAAEVDLATVAELLQQRSWEPSELLRELGRLFSLRGGRRLRFAGRLAAGLPVEVIEWCAEQCVKHGAPLPKGLARAEIAAIGGALRPEWVSAAAVSRLEKLGLDQAGTDRVAGWLLDGHVALPERDWPEYSLVAAVAETVQPSTTTTPSELAAVSRRLYSAHEPMWRVARERWLARLEATATAPLADVPSLTEVLKAAGATQWLLIDCLGLPLVAALEPILFEALAEWKSEPARFAEVSATTTTDACYRELLEVGGARLEKIDVVDELIHGDFLPFADLVSVCTTRLGTACKARRERLDPTAPLIVFADHGFRIAKNGRGYAHGGPSTLERIVPVWRLEPR